jgi:hypothetical protein
MIIEKVKMPAGKTIDLCEGVVDELCIESFTSFEECIFITERTVMWTTTGNDDGIRYEIKMTFDKVATNGWKFREIAQCGEVSLLRSAFTKVFLEFWQCFFTGTEKDRVGMLGCFFGQ